MITNYKSIILFLSKGKYYIKTKLCNVNFEIFTVTKSKIVNFI